MVVRGLISMALVAGLVFVGGCKDDEAHAKISTLTSENAELKQRVDALKKELDSVQQVTNFDEVIERKVNAKMELLEQKQLVVSQEDTKSIHDFVDMSKKSIEEMKEAMHVQVGDKDTAGVLEDHLQAKIAALAKVESDNRAKLKDEILRYIDSQLKDMYPYAFKRQRSNEPRKVSDQVDIP